MSARYIAWITALCVLPPMQPALAVSPGDVPAIAESPSGGLQQNGLK